ncbi:MAG TPA: DUF5916 domain-containing protein [Woeseiaceae bacterium]|nr:DUF5916 domain-containing protein [Woeseiaceae bacterium]
MRDRTRTRLLAVAAFAAVLPAQAEPPQAPKSIPAIHTASPPVLDGRLDDAAWAGAARIEDLHVVSPDEGGVPSEASRFFVVYGDDALYVGAELFDREPGRITARTLRQGDYSDGEDGVMLILDPFNQERSGYAFFLTANAVRSQALFTNVTDENWSWDGIWHGATRLTDDGWIAEIAIPLRTLSFDPHNGTWGINFYRFIGRRTEEIGWVSHNRQVNPASSGKLTGLAGLEQGLGLEIVPALVASETKDHAAGTTDSALEPSLDVSYKPTPALTATLTLNTDFTGTGADLRQVNLSRFDVFYPERRAFFLQDMDIFEFGRIGVEDGAADEATAESGRPFFSRRIGLAPDGEIIDLDGGLKITGRVAGFDYGVLGIRQGDYGMLEAADLYALRVSKNVLAESAVGMIATHGDPWSDIGNSLVGADFRYLNTRFASGITLEGAAWFQRTHTPGLDGDDAAFGFNVGAPNTEGWNGKLDYRELQENFRPALGFVSQAGVRSTLFEGGYIWRPDSDWLRSVETGMSGTRIETLEGRLDSQELAFDVLELANDTGDKLEFSLHDYRENLQVPFEILDGIVIPAGDYSWREVCAELETGQYRVAYGTAWACDGDFYDGSLRGAGVSATWRPNKHLLVAAGWEVNDIELPAGAFTTRQATLQADIAFTSTWYWENLVQYDNVSGNVGINSIVRWVPLAGRELVLVYNHELLDDPLADDDFEPAYSELLLKIYYTFRY